MDEMTKMTKMESEPEKPVEAVPVEPGGKYLLVMKDNMPPSQVDAARKMLDNRFGEGVVTILHGYEADLYRVEPPPLRTVTLNSEITPEQVRSFVDAWNAVVGAA